MDIGYTYSTPEGDVKVTVYAAPGLDVPARFQVRRQSDQQVVAVLRLSDRELTCDRVPGVTGDCTSHECHRRVLGECQCGRHPGVVEFRAVAS